MLSESEETSLLSEEMTLRDVCGCAAGGLGADAVVEFGCGRGWACAGGLGGRAPLVEQQ